MNDLGYTLKPLATITSEEIPPNHYLARIIRKASAKDANGMESQGVMLPVADLDTYLASDTVREYLVSCIHEVQGKIVRKVSESRGVVIDADISVDALSEYLEAEDSNLGRLSKDKITAWFDKELADMLTLAFAEKMGVSDSPSEAETTKLEQVVTQYRDCFGMLAAKSPSVSPTIGNNLRKALDMIPVSTFGIKVGSVLTKAMEQPSVDMLAL